MKKNIFIIISLCMGLLACEDNRMADIPDNEVYIVHSGEQSQRVLIQADKIHYDISIYRSGLGNASGDATLEINQDVLDAYNAKNGTSYEILPEEYYTIGKTSFSFNNESGKDTTSLEIDVKGVEKLQGIRTRKYVIPMKIKTNSNIALNNEKSEVIFIPEITGGMRENSHKALWGKTLDQLDNISMTDHLTASIAATEDYLFVNTRNQDLRYFDLLTGEFKGVVELPFKSSLGNFAIASDKKNSVIVTELRNKNDGSNVKQTIYIINGTSAPVKLIESEHPYPNGRKISVNGDLTKDAIITCSVEVSSKMIYWVIKDGNVVSQQPTMIEANPDDIKWNYQADAMAASADISDGYYMAGYGPNTALAYFDKNGATKHKYDLAGAGYASGDGFITQSLDIVPFNGAVYMAVAIPEWSWNMHGILLDVTFPSNLSMPPKSANVFIHHSGPTWCSPNANNTGEVCLQVLKDGKHMLMFMLGTNGSITCEQFDSVI